MLGPIAGLALFAVFLVLRGGSSGFHPLAFVGAFVMGGVPAVATGLLYCATAYVLAAKYGVVVSAALGSAVGAVAGCLISWVFFSFGPSTQVLLPEGRVHLIAIGTVSSVAMGLLSGWFLPVGRESHASRVREA
jgi:hypothetical protein